MSDAGPRVWVAGACAAGVALLVLVAVLARPTRATHSGPPGSPARTSSSEAKTVPPAAEQPPEPATAPRMRTEYPGAAVRGLQVVVSADRAEAAPGETMTFTWKLVNLTDEPLTCLLASPAVALKLQKAEPGTEEAGFHLAALTFTDASPPSAPGQQARVPPHAAITLERTFKLPTELSAVVTEEVPGRVMRRLQSLPLPSGGYEVTLTYGARPTGIPDQDAQLAANTWLGQADSGALPLRVKGWDPPQRLGDRRIPADNAETDATVDEF